MIGNQLAAGVTYKKSLKIRLAIQIIVLLWGVAALIISLVAHLSENMKSFYQGFGVGFTASAVVFVIYTLYLLLNKKAQECHQVRELDERNITIRQKAATMTASVTIILAAFAAIIAGAYSSTVMFTFIGVIFFMAAVYLVSFFFYRLRS